MLDIHSVILCNCVYFVYLARSYYHFSVTQIFQLSEIILGFVSNSHLITCFSYNSVIVINSVDVFMV